MKTIIALFNAGDRGKTATLRQLAIQILTSYPDLVLIYPESGEIPEKLDFRFVVKIGDQIVGIESKGDPKTHLESRLLEMFNKYKCDVVICATRTRGDSTTAVENVSRQLSIPIIWTSTYESQDSKNREKLNLLKAKHILDVMVSMKLINPSLVETL